MLGGTNYDTYFASLLVKNSNVFIFPNDNSGSYILDKHNIVKLTMNRVNLGVLEDIPADSTTIEVIWKTLDNRAKNYLVKGNIIKINPVVENEATDKCIIQVIDDVEVDYNGINAVITCSSPISLFTTSTTDNGTLLTNDMKTYPYKTSIAEDIQHGSIAYGYGRKVKVYYDDDVVSVNNQMIDYQVVLDESPVDTIFATLNVHKEGIKRYFDSPNKSAITVYGVDTTGEEEEIAVKRTAYYIAFIPLQEQCVVERITCQVLSSGTWIDAGAVIDNIFSNVVEVRCTWSNYSDYRFVLYGRRANVNVPNTVSVALKCYSWLDTQSNRLNRAQSVARAYYSHNEYYEFDCRLDPRFEPQDVIYVPTIGTLRIEGIETVFNGGFTGHIKARIIDEGLYVAKPIVTITSYNPNSFSFTIKNPNKKECLVHILCSSDEYSFSISPNSTITINNSNAPNLYDSFYAKAQGLLDDDVLCYLQMYMGTTSYSDNVIILEVD